MLVFIETRNNFQKKYLDTGFLLTRTVEAGYGFEALRLCVWEENFIKESFSWKSRYRKIEVEPELISQGKSHSHQPEEQIEWNQSKWR